MALPTGTNRDFADAHKQSDVDADEFSQHHTLGTEPGQAASALHTHFGPWIAFPAAGGIVNLGGAFQPAQIRKSDTLKIVQLRGVLKNNSGGALAPGAIIGTVPVGYRTFIQDVATQWTDTGGVQQFLRYDVMVNGDLIIQNAIAAGTNFGLLGVGWYLN